MKLAPPEKAFSPVPYFYIVLEPPQVVREFQEKFSEAQRKGDGHGKPFEVAFDEMEKGSKKTDWVWYVFPQHENCPGSTSLNDKYGLANREVLWFLADPYLRKNYLKVVTELKRHLESGKTLKEIVKDDVKKVISSLTLFEIVANGLHISDFFHKGGNLRETAFFGRIIDGEPEVADFVTDMKDIADLLGAIWISLEGFEPCEYTLKGLEETMCSTPLSAKAKGLFVGEEEHGYRAGEATLHERLTVPSKHFFYWVNNPDPLEKVDAESIEFRNHPQTIKEYEKDIPFYPLEADDQLIVEWEFGWERLTQETARTARTARKSTFLNRLTDVGKMEFILREYKKWPDVETFEKKVETYRWFKMKDEMDGLFNFGSHWEGDELHISSLISYEDEWEPLPPPEPSYPELFSEKDNESEQPIKEKCILCNEVFLTTFENEYHPNHRADRCSACGGSGPFFVEKEDIRKLFKTFPTPEI